MTPAATLAPAFVDLRRFAADAPRAIASPDAFHDGRHPLAGTSAPLDIAALRLAPGGGNGTSPDADEFVLVLDGGLAILSDGHTLMLAPGESAMLPLGSHFAWTADAETLAIVISYRPDAGTARNTAVGRQPAKLDRHAMLEPSAPPDPALLLTPTPACRNHVDDRSADGVFYCGTWDSTPYSRSHMHFRHCELMILQEGEVTLADKDGRSARFVAGDAVVVLQGADVSWTATGYVRKTYCMYRPA